jgi:hypothetical protein
VVHSKNRQQCGSGSCRSFIRQTGLRLSREIGLPRSMFHQAALQGFPEPLASKWFHDVVGRTRAQAADCRVEMMKPCRHNDGCLGMKAMQLLDEPEAALAAWEIDIAKRDGGEFL